MRSALKTSSLILTFVMLFAAAALSQDLVDDSSTAKYGRAEPADINSQNQSLDLIDVEAASSTASAWEQVHKEASGGNIPGLQTAPTFTRSFTFGGKVFPYTMLGNDPDLGHKTTIPAKITAVSLRLLNADGTTNMIVPVGPFEDLTLSSPNFEAADFTSGNNLQFADAVQRAEFFNAMKQNWHTDLEASIVNRVTINVPRFVRARLSNGQIVTIQAYYTSQDLFPRFQTTDGSTAVQLWRGLFNVLFSNAAVNDINLNNYTTNALNIQLYPNTYLFSVNSHGQRFRGDCCVLGFHTGFFDPSVTPTPIWLFAYASWISSGLFRGGFEDITALSHEISETFNDPLLNNVVPVWQFPGEPGACQNNLETGDPLEVLPTATVTLPIKERGTTFTYHPQTEALLQWFTQSSPSNALGGAFSYPDTTALTGPAIKGTCK